VKRIGICGTDLHAYRGRQPFFTYPRILGHELSGVIEEIDARDGGFRVGDKVCVIPYLHCGECQACRRGKTNCCENIQVMGVHADGGMREWISVPISHLILANELSYEESAVVETLSIGAHAVRRASPGPQDKVLVIGAGPIGLGVMMAAVRQGATVAAMDMVEHRLDFCRRWAGVEMALTGEGDVEEKLRQHFDGELPNIVFDATGNKASMERAFHYAAHGGTLVYVGLVRDDLTFHDPLFHARELTLLASRNATREDFEYVMKAMADGAVDAGAFVTHRVPFERVPDEFESWLNPASNVIKAMAVLD
jgi:2-desacetyl-2-hydroxyethyl bacteriochlorophyllide A dehydrogenase